MFPELMRDDVFRLETERLWLRWPRASDAVRISEYASDRDVALMTANIPYPYPAGAAAEFVLMSRAANLEGRRIALVLTLKQRPNEAIGCIDLRSDGEDDAGLGYWLAKPCWRQGHMSEAAGALINLVMRSTRVESLRASALPENTASCAVLAKLGFASEGFGSKVSRRRRRAAGQWK